MRGAELIPLVVSYCSRALKPKEILRKFCISSACCGATGIDTMKPGNLAGLYTHVVNMHSVDIPAVMRSSTRSSLWPSSVVASHKCIARCMNIAAAIRRNGMQIRNAWRRCTDERQNFWNAEILIVPWLLIAFKHTIHRTVYCIVLLKRFNKTKEFLKIKI